MLQNIKGKIEDYIHQLSHLGFYDFFIADEKRMSSPRKSPVRIYLSQTDDNCWEARSQQTEKVLRRMAVLPLTLYTRIKARDVRRLHEIPWW